MDLTRGICVLCSNNTRVINPPQAQEILSLIKEVLTEKVDIKEFDEINSLLKVCPLCLHDLITVDKLKKNFKERPSGNISNCCFLCNEGEILISINLFTWPYLDTILENATDQKRPKSCMVCLNCLKCLDMLEKIKVNLLRKYPQLDSTANFSKDKSKGTGKSPVDPKKMNRTPSPKKRQKYRNPSIDTINLSSNVESQNINKNVNNLNLALKHLQPLKDSPFNLEPFKQDKKLLKQIAFVKLSLTNFPDRNNYKKIKFTSATNWSDSDSSVDFNTPKHSFFKIKIKRNVNKLKFQKVVAGKLAKRTHKEAIKSEGKKQLVVRILKMDLGEEPKYEEKDFSDSSDITTPTKASRKMMPEEEEAYSITKKKKSVTFAEVIDMEIKNEDIKKDNNESTPLKSSMKKVVSPRLGFLKNGKDSSASSGDENSVESAKMANKLRKKNEGSSDEEISNKEIKKAKEVHHSDEEENSSKGYVEEIQKNNDDIFNSLLNSGPKLIRKENNDEGKGEQETEKSENKKKCETKISRKNSVSSDDEEDIKGFSSGEDNKYSTEENTKVDPDQKQKEIGTYKEGKYKRSRSDRVLNVEKSDIGSENAAKRTKNGNGENSEIETSTDKEDTSSKDIDIDSSGKYETCKEGSQDNFPSSDDEKDEKENEKKASSDNKAGGKKNMKIIGKSSESSDSETRYSAESDENMKSSVNSDNKTRKYERKISRKNSASSDGEEDKKTFSSDKDSEHYSEENIVINDDRQQKRKGTYKVWKNRKSKSSRAISHKNSDSEGESFTKKKKIRHCQKDKSEENSTDGENYDLETSDNFKTQTEESQDNSHSSNSDEEKKKNQKKTSRGKRVGSKKTKKNIGRSSDSSDSENQNNEEIKEDKPKGNVNRDNKTKRLKDWSSPDSCSDENTNEEKLVTSMTSDDEERDKSDNALLNVNSDPKKKKNIKRKRNISDEQSSSESETKISKKRRKGADGDRESTSKNNRRGGDSEESETEKGPVCERNENNLSIGSEGESSSEKISSSGRTEEQQDSCEKNEKGNILIDNDIDDNSSTNVSNNKETFPESEDSIDDHETDQNSEPKHSSKEDLTEQFAEKHIEGTETANSEDLNASRTTANNSEDICSQSEKAVTEEENNSGKHFLDSNKATSVSNSDKESDSEKLFARPVK